MTNLNNEKLALEQLVQSLQSEGTLTEYYHYLQSRYGSFFGGDLFGYSLQYSSDMKEAATSGDNFAEGLMETSDYNYRKSTTQGICEDFLYSAMTQDLRRKSLENIFQIAEVEKRYSKHPYLRAIDIMYKLNLSENSSADEITEAVVAYETGEAQEEYLKH